MSSLSTASRAKSDEEQVDLQQAAHPGVVAVDEPGGAEPFEEPVAASKSTLKRRRTAAHGGVAEGGGETKVLPTPTDPTHAIDHARELAAGSAPGTAGHRTRQTMTRNSVPPMTASSCKENLVGSRQATLVRVTP